MKRKTPPIKTAIKKQTLEGQIDSLARIVVSGFEKIDKRFEQVDKRFEQVDKRFEQVDEKFDKIDGRFDEMDSRLNSMSYDLKDHSVRLERIEKRQMGTLATLDETVHRNEFKNLTKRVLVLERKK